MNPYSYVFFLIPFAVYLLVVLALMLNRKARLKRIMAATRAMSIDTFLSKRKMHQLDNKAGIYILHNKTKDMYYVGQGDYVISRAFKHFSGAGQGDVYADYKFGDRFTIKIIYLRGSGFFRLNSLEKTAIEILDAYDYGYNKTHGNK